MTPSGRRSYVPNPNDDASGKRRGGKPEWVQPSLLIGLALVLVAITTIVVAVRSRSRAPGPATEGRAVPREGASTGGQRVAAMPGAARGAGTTDGAAPVVSGRPDPGEAQGFHAGLIERLAPRLRTIGLRPQLIARAPGRDGGADRWEVRVPSNFPVLRANAEMTFLARELGGAVYRAEQDSADLALVTLFVGAGNVVTDEVRLRREKKLKFKGTIAFVIDDVGYRAASGTMEFIQLPYALTFAILPQHESGAEIARKALAAGKEVILHLPMEPNGDGADTEPHTILTTMSDQDIRRYTDQHLASVPGLSGVNNHMGSKATEDERVMRTVLSVLRERGLYFLDSRTTAKTVAEELARGMEVRTGRRDVFLDNERPTLKVIQEILRAASIAAREGRAIAIGHDRTETYQALLQTLPRLEEEGYRICLLSELLR